MHDSTKQSNEKNSLLLMFLTLLSRLLGVVKAMVTSHYFGAGALNDAINFAYNIPNNARKLFAEGAFSASYIPTFAACKEDRGRTQKLASLLLTVQLLFFIPIIVLTFFFGENIITTLSAFTDKNQIAVASTLLPLFTIFLTFISFGSIFSGILQANSLFFMVGLCPVFYSGSVILGIVLFAPQYSHLAFGYATVIGSILQFLSCYLASKKLGLKLSVSFEFNNEDFKTVLKRLLPISITNIVSLLAQQITYYFASFLPEGSISAFANSIILYQTPYGIFFTAIATVYYPIFSQQSQNRLGELSKSLVDLFTFLLPSSIALITLNKEIIAILFQHGAFTLENTYLTASVAFYYFAALSVMGFFSMLQRYNFAQNNYWYTTIIIIGINLLDLFLSFGLIKTFNSAIALPIAFIISQCCGVLLLFIKVKGFDYLAFIKSLLKLVVANLPLIILCLIIKSFNLSFYQRGTSFSGFIITVALGLLMIFLTLLSYTLFKVPFLRALKKSNATN